MQVGAFQAGDFRIHSDVVFRLPPPSGKSPAPSTPIKFAFDKLFALATMPSLILIALALLLLNPLFNRGPLFYVQDRMGLGGTRFRIIKFRTMTPSVEKERAAHERLEEDRITPLGRLLRRTRIDELPNIINVLKGDMSVVGPRPEFFAHAIAFIATVPRYRDRFQVRPGITGLAQVCGGYADTQRAVLRKARLDSFYVRKHRAMLDLCIIFRTPAIMLSGFGAR